MSGDTDSSLTNIRQGIVEWLQMVAGYPSDPPPWNLSETINQWYDWNSDHPCREDYPAPFYSQEEALALLAVGEAMERFCDITPQEIQNDAEEMARPEWRALTTTVCRALEVIARKENP